MHKRTRATASSRLAEDAGHLSLPGVSTRRPSYRTGPAPSEDDGYHLDRHTSLALTRDRWSAPSKSRSALALALALACPLAAAGSAGYVCASTSVCNGAAGRRCRA